MGIELPRARTSPRSRILLVVLGCAACLLLWILQGRSLQTTRAAYLAQFEQATLMRSDAAYIRAMQAAPRLAVDRERPNDALLAQIQGGIEAAGIPVSDWVANEPHAPMRIPQTPFKKMALTCVLQNVSLRQISLLLHQLTTGDPSLLITQLRLTTGNTAPERWNATLSIAYHIYAPMN